MSSKSKKNWNRTRIRNKDEVKEFFQECRAIFLIVFILGTIGVVLWLAGKGSVPGLQNEVRKV